MSENPLRILVLSETIIDDSENSDDQVSKIRLKNNVSGTYWDLERAGYSVEFIPYSESGTVNPLWYREGETAEAILSLYRGNYAAALFRSADGSQYAYDVIMYSSTHESLPNAFKAQLQLFVHLGGTLVDTDASAWSSLLVDTPSGVFPLGDGFIVAMQGTAPSTEVKQSALRPHTWADETEQDYGGVLVLYDGHQEDDDPLGPATVQSWKDLVSDPSYLLPLLQQVGAEVGAKRIRLSPLPEFYYAGDHALTSAGLLATSGGATVLRYDAVLHIPSSEYEDYNDTMPLQGRQHLREFVERGGTLLTMAWGAYEDEYSDSDNVPISIVSYSDEGDIMIQGVQALPNPNMPLAATLLDGLGDVTGADEDLVVSKVTVDGARDQSTGAPLVVSDPTDAAEVLLTFDLGTSGTTPAVVTQPVGLGRIIFSSVVYHLAAGDTTKQADRAYVHLLASNFVRWVYADRIAGVGGDPYLMPLQGPPIKLPNCSDTYRLLHAPQLGLVVNAEVSRATPAQRKKLRAQIAARDCGGLVPVDDGFYLSRLWIQCESNAYQIDLHKGATELLRADLPWGSVHMGSSRRGLVQGKYLSRSLRLSDSMRLEVRFYANAQVQNELRLVARGPVRGDGLLLRNYRPKLFRLNQLQDTSVLRRRRGRMRTQKCPVAQGEHRDSVLFPQYFGARA